MPVTSPDNIWTPDSGDDYALTVDLARTADDVQDALNKRPIPGTATSGVPWRMAAGINNVSDVDYTTIPFPAGRFNRPPVVVAQSGGTSTVSVTRVIDVTATSFRVGIWSLGAVRLPGTVSWTAVQMTETTTGG